jgi:hypothetical protein
MRYLYFLIVPFLLSNAAAVAANAAPTAIHLLYFQSYEEGPYVKLQWATDAYLLRVIIEHSTDAKNYTKIGVGAKSRGSKNSKEYLYFAPKQNGLNYYRLKYFHTNGSSSYSRPLRCDIGRTAVERVVVYPASVPKNGVLQVFVSNKKTDTAVKLRLRNLEGKLIYEDMAIDPSLTLLNLKMSELPVEAGTYSLELLVGQRVFTHRVRVSNAR